MTEWDPSVANPENQASRFLASAVPHDYTMWVAEAGLCLLFMLFLSAPVSRDDVEGLLLMEEEGHSDLISFQPTDSDIPSFLEDCNRVRPPLPIHLVLSSCSALSTHYSQREFLFEA